jgi:hypothetical protein
VQYGSKPALTLGQNELRFVFSAAPLSLDQIMSIGQGRSSQIVHAVFDARHNQTVIVVTTGLGEGEDEDNQGQRIIKPGLVLLEMRTTKGRLAITY